MNENKQINTTDITHGEHDGEPMVHNGCNGTPPSPKIEIKPTSPPPPPKEKGASE